MVNNNFFKRPTIIAGYMMIAVMLLAVLLCSCSQDTDAPVQTTSQTDLILNEVLTSNSSSAKAYDGRYYDWVELYNPTSEEITLDGYYLSDDLESLQKTSLSGQKIDAKGYLVIYCSGLNITDERGCLHTNFKLSAADGETVYLSDETSLSSLTVPASKENVSYGLTDDGVTYGWFEEPTPGRKNEGTAVTEHFEVRINEYMTSNTFTMYDCEGDYGDWVELYNPSSDAFDLSGCGLTDNEADPFKYTFPDGTVLNGGAYLVVFCDGKDKTDTDGMLHTGFSLSARDGFLSLYSSEQMLGCRVMLYDLPANISYGWSDGEGDYRFFARSTPGKANASTAFSKLSAEMTPELTGNVIINETLSASSKRGGASASDFIELYNTTSSAVSLKGYTLANRPGTPVYTFPDVKIGAGEYLLLLCDGTTAVGKKSLHIPVKIGTGGETLYLADASGTMCDVFSTGKGRCGVSSGRLAGDTSHRFFFSVPTPGEANSGRHYSSFAPAPVFSTEGGLVKSGTKVSLSVTGNYKIVYTTDGSAPTASSKIYSSPIKIEKNTVIRAAAFGGDALISECVTQTYFTQNPHTLPIMCISGTPSDININKGIFLNEESYAEKSIYVEYFNQDCVKEVEFPCGAKLFGFSSRKCLQKGVKLSLREIYGVNEITYPFFSGNDKAATTFSRLLLRPSGEDQIFSKLRDELVPALIRGHMDLDYQEFQPCVLYLNGNYWGLYYIREQLGADYLNRYYGYEKGDFDIVKAQHINQEGNLKAYSAMVNFCKNNDLSEKKNYDELCKTVDMESLINFWIAETYFGNTDTVNIRCYKHRDGKWRWMIYDMDWSMQTTGYIREQNFIYSHLLNPEGHGIGHRDNTLMRKLLENDEFRARFITAYCYHMNTTFAPERAVAILDEMAATIDGEIKLNQKRWGRPKYSEWSEKTVPFLRNYLETRPEKMKADLMESFHLSEEEWDNYVRLSKDYRQENDPIK